MEKAPKGVVLNRRQKQQLEEMLVRGRWSSREIGRVKILLVAHSQKELNKAKISRETGSSEGKVRRVIGRYLQRNSIEDALKELPRSGQPEKLTEKEQSFIVATCCTPSPDGTEHWTLELLQKQLMKVYKKKVCLNCIKRVEDKNQLKPWKKKDVVYTEIG